MLSDLYLFFNEHWDSIWLSHLQTLRSHRFYQHIHQTLPRGWKKGTEYQDPSPRSEFSQRWASFIHKMLLRKGFSCVRKTTLIKEGRSLQINILSILKWENQDTQCLGWLVGWWVGWVLKPLWQLSEEWVWRRQTTYQVNKHNRR